ncbi:SHD1 domain-containing protein [Neorhodopirellula lusitana]|uniref:SHD1 domain-containing protein n=1 Tax=Neorhodopirellula lusitana TaxID=445327 RepID=UPI00384F2643
MNANLKIRSLSLACLFLICVSPFAIAREWVDRTGAYKVEAELVTVRDGKAYLEKPDGQIRKVPLKLLSNKDLAFISSMPRYEAQVKPFLPSTLKPTTSRSPTAKMAIIQVDSPNASGSIRQFRSGSWGYKGLEFSNDGAYLFTLGNDNITVMDINASRQTAYKIGSGSRSTLAFSPDGKRLFAGAREGIALTWKHDGKGKLEAENEFTIHKGEVKAIAVSPDNQHAMTIHYPNAAYLWDVESGEVLAGFDDFHFTSGGDIRFSRHGGQAMITDGRIGAVIDVASQKIIQHMELSRGSGQFAKITADGSSIATGRTYDIHSFHTGSESKPTVMEGNESIWSAEFSPNGKRLISGGRENVKLWNVETGMPVKKFQMGDGGYVHHVAFSPDGIHFAAIGAPIGQLVEVFRLSEEESGR